MSDCQVLGSFKVGPSLVQEVGIGSKSPRQVHHAQLNYYAELKVPLKQHKRGFSVTHDALLPPGTFLRAGHFVAGQLVDVQAKSIGKGFQGAMKRWGFAGMPASHGNSLSHRAIGCTGARSDPGRTFKGKKMAGRMGGHFVTVRRLKVLKVDHALNCIMVRGAVPGHDNQAVRVVDSKSCTRRELVRLCQARALPFPTLIPSQETPLPREEIAEFYEKDPLFVGTTEK